MELLNEQGTRTSTRRRPAAWRCASSTSGLQLLIVAIRSEAGETVFNPEDDVEFRAGDTIIVMGPEADLKNFRHGSDVQEPLCTTV